MAAVAVPVVLDGEGRNLLVQQVEHGAGRVGRHMFAVEEGLGVGHARQQSAHRVSITAERGAMVSQDARDVQSVGVVVCACQQRHGDGEADVVQVTLGSQAVLGNLVDVEGELGADVLVRALGIVDVGAVLHGQRGELGADGEVDRLWRGRWCRPGSARARQWRRQHRLGLLASRKRARMKSPVRT